MGIRVQFLVQRNSMIFALQTALKTSKTYKALWKYRLVQVSQIFAKSV
ncbi:MULTISPECIES: hypothetical protein [Vibrio]|nr:MULTISPECIES: hypothetical protein [Vibrio]MDH5935048.1 hypothetical protein [Vibrio splendidus]MDP2589637.1 hypothetical protein [Vibrio splendidus]CAK3446241.1 hypothetical protein VCRA2128O103_290011 [Vibrio crassostreae]CAK3525793.1 hypothetical protein VCRA2128O104_300036 [Vibrio crassostreae]CAK3951503.1 hypothetical protein VCRA2128O99_320038 [Vibrio crassostreae]